MSRKFFILFTSVRTFEILNSIQINQINYVFTRSSLNRQSNISAGLEKEYSKEDSFEKSLFSSEINSIIFYFCISVCDIVLSQLLKSVTCN